MLTRWSGERVATVAIKALDVGEADLAQPGANRLDQGLEGGGAGAAQMALEFGEDLFNGIEVGRVGGQEMELAASGFNGRTRSGMVVDPQIVQNHGGAWSEGGDKTVLHPLGKEGTIQGPFEDPRRAHPRGSQRGQAGHVGSMVARHPPNHPLAAWGASVGAGQGGLGAGFIKKDQRFWGIGSHLLPPLCPRLRILLGGDHGLFLSVMPSRRNVRPIVGALTSVAVWAHRAQCSAKVASGCAAT